MAYTEFVAGFQAKTNTEGQDFLSSLVNGLYADDIELNGQLYTCRRMTDEVIDPKQRLIRTGFFCFPQDPSDKHKMNHGGFVYIDTICSDMDGMQLTFSEPNHITFVQPQRYDIYHAIVANRARKQLVLQGTNNFLFHDIFITTPEQKTFDLEEFDFSRHQLFMLGLIGGEFKISIKPKQAA